MRYHAILLAFNPHSPTPSSPPTWILSASTVTRRRSPISVEKGYFFIADFSGYTGFLASSELEHAKEISDTLFESILNHMAPPLMIADSEGDAIFAYAESSALKRPELLLEVADDLYFEFRRRLELMRANTTCQCNACVNMSALDLKVFVHFGEYLPQSLGGGLQLQGADVILVHRLMKNRVQETTGLTGYLLVTEAALSQMEDPSLRDDFIPHFENYDHLGRIPVWLQDLHDHWRDEKARRRPALDPSEAWARGSTEVPVSPWVAWDYATHLSTKRDYLDLISVSRTDGQGGRTGEGSTFHCAHELSDFFYVIEEWDPPHHFIGNTEAFGLRFLYSTIITPTDLGSKVEILYYTPYEGEYEDMQPMFEQIAKTGMARFARIIEGELEAGNIQMHA